MGTPPSEQKKPLTFDQLINLFSENFSQVLKNPADRIVDFTKVYGLAFGYQMLGVIAISIVGLMLGLVFAGIAGTFNIYEVLTYAAVNSQLALVFLGLWGLATILIAFVAGWYAYGANLAVFRAVEYHTQGTRIPVRKEATALRPKALGVFVVETIFGVFLTAVMAAFMILPFVGAITNPAQFESQSSEEAIGFILSFYIFMFLAMGVTMVLSFGWAFLTQFWKVNVALTPMRWKDGFASSVEIIRKNFWTVLLFDIIYAFIYGVLSFGIGIVSFLIMIPLQLIGYFVAIFVPFLSVPIAIGTYLLQLVMTVLTLAILAAFLMPAKVAFWKQLREEPQKEGKRGKSAS